MEITTMIATLKFKFPDEKDEFKDAVNASNYRYIIEEMMD